MIGRLRGDVVDIDNDTAIIDVAGVGYEVHATMRQLQAMSVGSNVTISIETIVREDFIRLYGFASQTERQMFRLLQTVQGVGAKHALAMLDALRPSEIIDAIIAGDATTLSRAHGVGKKLAQRIASELEGKVGSIAATGAALRVVAGKSTAVTPDDAPTAASGMASDAVLALCQLGYEPVEARRAVAAAAGGADSVESLIKGALKHLSAA